MHTIRYPELVFSGLAMVLAAGHASADGVSTAAPTHSHAHAHTTAAYSPRGYTRVALKKGGSGVALAYKVDGTPEVGKPVMVKIQMTSPADALVTVRSDSGLQLSGPELVMRSSAGALAEHNMSVTPLATGRHYLFITSTAFGRTSASAIAVQVGKDTPLAKPTGDIKIMPGGERLKSMPAQ